MPKKTALRKTDKQIIVLKGYTYQENSQERYNIKPKCHNIELKGLAVCKTLHLSRHCRIQHILTFYASFYYSN